MKRLTLKFFFLPFLEQKIFDNQIYRKYVTDFSSSFFKIKKTRL
jgi:hypothetical protein